MTDQQATAHRFSWPSFSLWVGLTLVGFLMAGFFIHIGAVGPTTSFNPRDLNLSAALVGFLFGGVSGLIIASLQWLVLKSWAPNARLWIPLNAVGFGLEHAFNDALPYRPLDLPLILAIGGIIIGLAQSIALRHTLSKAFLWVPVAVFAWFLGLQLGFAWLIIFDKNPLAELATVFGTAGLTIGTITGVALRLLIADNLAVPKNLTRSTLTSRWSYLKLSTKILIFLFMVVIAVFVVFAGVLLGMM
jgi:hypothetical protein